MLVLTRKLGETVCIGNAIKITALGIVGAQARIGISAPEAVKVHREEVYLRIQQQAGKTA